MYILFNGWLTFGPLCTVWLLANVPNPNISTWTDIKVRELIAGKVLHTSLLNTTVVVFKVLPLESYAPMLARSTPFKTILEMV